MESKDYVKREVSLTEEQLELVYKLYEENRVPPKMPDLAPFSEFSIRYQFSTIGVAKIMDIGDKSFIINEDEIDMC